MTEKETWLLYEVASCSCDGKSAAQTSGGPISQTRSIFLQSSHSQTSFMDNFWANILNLITLVGQRVEFLTSVMYASNAFPRIDICYASVPRKLVPAQCIVIQSSEIKFFLEEFKLLGGQDGAIWAKKCFRGQSSKKQ